MPTAHARTPTEPHVYDLAAVPRAPERRSRTPSPAARERARRRRHVRQLRRDLLVDALAALVVLLLVSSVTAGLAVIALLAVPVTGLLAFSYARDRRRRRRPVADR